MPKFKTKRIILSENATCGFSFYTNQIRADIVSDMETISIPEKRPVLLIK